MVKILPKFVHNLSEINEFFLIPFNSFQWLFSKTGDFLIKIDGFLLLELRGRVDAI